MKEPMWSANESANASSRPSDEKYFQTGRKNSKLLLIPSYHGKLGVVEQVICLTKCKNCGFLGLFVELFLGLENDFMERLLHVN